MRYRSFVHAAIPLLCAASLVAQEAVVCSTGPGVALGITGYQCANCSFNFVKGRRASYSFMTEPVVTNVADGSKVLVGDVVEAVNGKPITTNAGSDQFAYPAVGENTVTVRRGRDHQTIRISGAETLAWVGAKGIVGCGVSGAGGRGIGRGVGGGSATGGGTGDGVRYSNWSASFATSNTNGRNITIRGAAQSDTGPLIIVDGVVVSGSSQTIGSPKTGKYGFAVSCESECKPATDTDGPLMYTYYKHGTPPSIVAVRENSPAERAGLKVNDVLLKIEGRSIVDDEAALLLARVDKRDSVRLTVRRDGKEFDLLLAAKP